MANSAFDSIFCPRSVAVIGASPDSKRLGYYCLQSLITSRFPGNIYPIHPSLPEILGFKAYPSVTLVSDEVDLAIIAIRTSLVPAALRECIEKGVKGVVLITAGFREIEDKAGAELQDEITAMANAANIKIIGPNTFGIVNLQAGLNASFTPEFSLTPKGNISMVSQSGGFCHLMVPLAMAEHVGLSKIIGLGNRCNVDFADVLDYLGDDPDTKVIIMYIEGTDDARRLYEVARRVSVEKPIVALKAGRFAARDEAAYSHTGSMAGEPRVYGAAFEQAGIISVNSSTELLDTAKVLALCPLPQSNRVATLSEQAGPGIIVCDTCEEHGLVMARFSDKTIARVAALLPPLAGMKSNPIDMNVWNNGQTVSGVIEAVLEDENIDGIVLYAAYTPAITALPRAIAGLLKSPRKPVISCFPCPPGVWVEEKQHFDENGVAFFPTPERAAKAMVALVKRSQIVNRSRL